MTLKEKIEQTRAAYEVLKPYVDYDRYFAYMQGLLDARNIEVSADEERIAALSQPSHTKGEE